MTSFICREVCLSKLSWRPGMLQSPSLVQRALLNRNNRRAKETGCPLPPFVFFNYVIAVFSTLDIHLTVRTRSVDPVSVTRHDLRQDSPRRKGRDYWVIKMLSLKTFLDALTKRQDPVFRFYICLSRIESILIKSITEQYPVIIIQYSSF